MNKSQEFQTKTCLEKSESQEANLEELTLTSLPDVALLRVLWYLPAVDLSALGRVHPRLADLMRRERSVWRGKSRVLLYDRPVDALFSLLQEMPPNWTKLNLGIRDPEEPLASRALTVETWSIHDALGVLDKLGSGIRVLFLRNFTSEMDIVLHSVGRCKSLERLDVYWTDYDDVYYWHPDQGTPYTVPPKLKSIGIAFENDEFYDLDESSYLYSFLKAIIDCGGSERSLRHLALRSPPAFPLLELCPRDLGRVAVSLHDELTAKLLSPLSTSELKELEILETDPEYLLDSAAEDEVRACVRGVEQLAEVLRAWRGPLLRLKLDLCPEVVVSALGSGALSSLTRLELGYLSPDVLRVLPAALAGLPAVFMVSLSTSAPAPAFFCELSRTSIPALRLIIVVNTRCSYRLDSSPARAMDLAIRRLALGKSVDVVLLQPKCTVVCPCKTLSLHYYKSEKHSPGGLERKSCIVCDHAQAVAELETSMNELEVEHKKSLSSN
ncbi:Cyclin-F [Frankliniella fusca]|uniref:Cyclin-F n=1 Tax=Frankliniella fusca TaxID=407009 RepID=A0AAE1LXG0_9NEOP|nr:Cyclin-F [Frankliniella fusca]